MSDNLTNDEQLAAIEVALGIVPRDVPTTLANQHEIINENREANLIRMQFLEEKMAIRDKIENQLKNQLMNLKRSISAVDD